MQAIETARLTLLSQLEPIDTEAAELEARLAELNEDRSRLKAALKALDATKKPKAKAGGKASKPSPKQKDVREVAVELVKDNRDLTKAELEALTKDKLTNGLGFDLKGFEMRWNEVMASGTFAFDNGDVVTLTTEQSNSANSDKDEKCVA